MNLPDLVVIGPLLIDEIFLTGATLGHQRLGGSGLYSALAAACCGVKVGLVSMIGNDYPEDVLQKLAQKNIDLNGVTRMNNPSCRCQLYYTESDRYYIFPEGYPDFSEVCPTPREIPAQWLQCKNFHIAPFIFNRQLEILAAVNQIENVTISLDPVDIIEANKTEYYLSQLQNIHFFMPSETEFKLFNYEHDVKLALEKIANKINAHVILKKSEVGSIAINYPHSEFIETDIIKNINALDITGAGDTFCGAFHATWLMTKNLKKSLQMATVLASFVIEEESADRLFNLTLEEIQQRYLHEYGLPLF